jgi:hypothetical protein
VNYAVVSAVQNLLLKICAPSLHPHEPNSASMLDNAKKSSKKVHISLSCSTPAVESPGELLRGVSNFEDRGDHDQKPQ